MSPAWMNKPLRGLTLSLLGCALVAVFSVGCGKASDFEEEEGDGVPVTELTEQERHELELFAEPKMTADEEAFALKKYEHVDPHGVVPRGLLKKALTYYDSNRVLLKNDLVLTVVDFSARSSRARMYIVDMISGTVEKYHVAHGKGSDPRNTGYASRFSNRPNSHRSSLGFYRTAETYMSPKHGLALRLDGLSPTNSNVRKRAIVLHGATYVHDRDIKQGRSSGCFAVSDAMHEKVVNRLRKGSIIFAGLSR